MVFVTDVRTGVQEKCMATKAKAAAKEKEKDKEEPPEKEASEGSSSAMSGGVSRASVSGAPLTLF